MHQLDTKTCDGADCGEVIAMVPIRKKDGTYSSKPHPFDIDPTPAGTYRFEVQSDKSVVAVHDPKFLGDLYITHFATCPNAPTFRR